MRIRYQQFAFYIRNPPPMVVFFGQYQNVGGRRTFASEYMLCGFSFLIIGIIDIDIDVDITGASFTNTNNWLMNRSEPGFARLNLSVLLWCVDKSVVDLDLFWSVCFHEIGNLLEHCSIDSAFKNTAHHFGSGNSGCSLVNPFSVKSLVPRRTPQTSPTKTTNCIKRSLDNCPASKAGGVYALF